ncbi:hypothetical protein D3C84_1178150 [compost metagenome]
MMTASVSSKWWKIRRNAIPAVTVYAMLGKELLVISAIFTALNCPNEKKAEPELKYSFLC